MSDQFWMRFACGLGMAIIILLTKTDEPGIWRGLHPFILITGAFAWAWLTPYVLRS